MKCACSFTPVLAIVGLVGLGIGGFNMARSGCPLGTCSSAATSTVTTVSAPAAGDECPMHKCSGASEANVQTVALQDEAAATQAHKDCCQGKDAACCKAMSDKECADKMASGCPAAASECHATKVADKDKGTN